MPAKAKQGNSAVCVIGLGYVGLPLAQAFSRSRRVIGFDIDAEKVRGLQKSSGNQNLYFTTKPEDIGQADFIIICVPTPVTKTKKINLSYIKSAARTAGQNMKKGSVVILESTVYPGATEEVIKPILEKESGMKCGRYFRIGYSPERINPGDSEHTVEKTIKVVAGADDETTDILARLYKEVAADIFKAKDIRTAEAAKVIENIQRDLNIAFVNELSVICEKLGLNTRDVLKAAETKWNFHHYYPGLVGGYCIPVNPYYLVHKAREVGYEPQVILAGREINNSVPKRVAGMMLEALKKAGKKAKTSSVLIMGLTYKANVSDIRESAAKELASELAANGVKVSGYDPNVDNDNWERNWEDKSDIGMIWDAAGLKRVKADGIILTVAHSALRKISLSDLKKIQNANPILIDVPASYDAEEAKEAGFSYRTL